MLAMDSRAQRLTSEHALSLTIIASMLAPTMNSITALTQRSKKSRHYPARTEGGPDMKIPQSRQARLWDRFAAVPYLIR